MGRTNKMRLDPQSPYDQKATPFLHNWDTEYRRNYDDYQKDIDKLTFHLQKSQRAFGPFGSWGYPNFFQRDFLLLALLKRKQLVGKVFPEEINEYQQINQSIRDDLNKTFKAKFYIPYRGFAIGLGANVFAHLFNFQYSFRLGFLVLPPLVEYIWVKTGSASYVRSLDFLNWVLELRKAKAQLEVDGASVYNRSPLALQKYRQATKELPNLYEIYDELINLVNSESQQPIE
eukprot:TRINITY_DN305_c0_g2_i1.p1 TRINITY_DN305_c0_g2~~TRINITY_DN305_c0_g2_i1.p1  ORF type:complete len:231 (+),score=69.30 TRINITY_DN305_c0_g2_i1:94-786(+)